MQSLESKLSKLTALEANIKSLRPLQTSRTEGAMEFGFSCDFSLQPIDLIHFKHLEWTSTPWEGVTCLGLNLTEDQVTVLCQVDRPILMEAHSHGEWAEHLTMHKGVLFDHITKETFSPHSGAYIKAPGEIHLPEFKTPAQCLVTWSRG